MFDMRRREFILLLGGAGLLCAAKARRARAQQSSMPVIEFLNGQSPDGSTEQSAWISPGLKESGFVEGENIAIEYRWAENLSDRLPTLAADLVHRRVEVIAVFGNVASLVAKAATASGRTSLRLATIR